VQPLAAGVVGVPVTEVLAHGSDPVAVIGVFAPALVVVALVVGLVVRDRRRTGGDPTERAEDDAGVSPPPAG